MEDNKKDETKRNESSAELVVRFFNLSREYFNNGDNEKGRLYHNMYLKLLDTVISENNIVEFPDGSKVRILINYTSKEITNNERDAVMKMSTITGANE